MCTTDICNLQACSKWISSHGEWFPCVDCQEKDYEGWPTGSLSDRLPVEYLTEDTYTTIAELCSKQDEPAMPNVPIVTSLHRVAPQALVNTEGWVVDVDFTEDGVFRGKILRAGRDEQGAHRVIIAWLNGEASSVFSHPEETEGIWLLFDNGKLAVEDSDEEAAEPLTDEERASRADLFSSGKLTKNQKKAAARETKRRLYGVPLVDYMGRTYLTPPQLQEAVHDILTREVSALKSVEAPMQRYLGVLERARVGQITEEELIAATVRYRTDSGKAMSEVEDGEFAGLINQSEGGRPGNDGRGGAIINYVTKRAALKHQKDCSTTDNNLTFRTDPCVRALDSIARFLDRRARGVEKSDIVNCSSMIIFDMCLHAFDLEDKSTSTKREKSYWKAIDDFCGKADISRDVYFLGNGLLLYGEIEIHWLRHHKPFPLMTASGYADLELLNCPAPNTVTKKLRVTGDITHTENWVSDRIVGYSGGKKDGLNVIINDFFPCLSELAHLSEVPEPIDIAWKWAAAGLTKEDIEDRAELKREGALTGLETQANIRAQARDGSRDASQWVWSSGSGLRDYRIALSDARGAGHGERSETQQDLLWSSESGLREVHEAYRAQQRGEQSKTQQDLLEATNAGIRRRHEESSIGLGMEKAVGDNDVITMRCENSACKQSNVVVKSEWTYEGMAVIEKCLRKLKNGGQCHRLLKPVSTRGLGTISRNAVAERERAKKMSEEQKEAKRAKNRESDRKRRKRKREASRK